MKSFIGLVALSQNYVIGQNNKLPWYNATDFKWFKAMTANNVIVVGRKTYESIARPLPFREIVVLTRNNEYKAREGVKVVSSISQLSPVDDAREYFICGGSEVYQDTVPMCSDFFVTKIKQTIPGPGLTYFRMRYFDEYFKYVRCVYNDSQITIEHYHNTYKIGDLSKSLQDSIQEFDKSIKVLYKAK